MIEINLVPDVKQELLKAQTVRSAVVSISIVVGVIAAGLVVLVAIYVYGVQWGFNNVADDTTKKRNAELQSIEDINKTLTIQNQMASIDATGDARQTNTRLLDMLQVIVPTDANEVTISKLTKATEEGTIEIEAQALNSYQAAEIFKKSIDGAEVQYLDDAGEIQSVKLSSGTQILETAYGEDSDTNQMILTFKISFTYAPELLDAKLNGVKLVQTTTGNVTDSYLGVPRSIFADRIPTQEEN